MAWQSSKEQTRHDGVDSHRLKHKENGAMESGDENVTWSDNQGTKGLERDMVTKLCGLENQLELATSQSREPRGHAVAKSVAEMVGGCYRQPFANGFESSGIYAADGEMKAGMTGEEVSNTAACHQAGLSHPMSPLASIKRQLSGEDCSLSMQLKGIFWWVGGLGTWFCHRIFSSNFPHLAHLSP